MRSFFFLFNFWWNPEFHAFIIQVKVGLLEKLNRSMRRGWEATALLREGKLSIKNLSVAFCEKRPHLFFPEVNEMPSFLPIEDFNQISPFVQNAGQDIVAFWS